MDSPKHLSSHPLTASYQLPFRNVNLSHYLLCSSGLLRDKVLLTLASLLLVLKAVVQCRPCRACFEPEIGQLGQRPPTMINPAAHNDKSGAASISSVARSSVSRNSSRITSVPPIHSIPDSPRPGYPHVHLGSIPRVARSLGSLVCICRVLVKEKVSYECYPSLTPQHSTATNNSVCGESPAESSTGDLRIVAYVIHAARWSLTWFSFQDSGTREVDERNICRSAAHPWLGVGKDKSTE